MLDRFIPYRILSPHGWILLLDNKNIHMRFFFNPFHNMKLTSLIAFSSPLQPILMVSTILLFIKSYRTFMICRFDDDWRISWYNQYEWEWKEVVVSSNIIFFCRSKLYGLVQDWNLSVVDPFCAPNNILFY